MFRSFTSAVISFAFGVKTEAYNGSFSSALYQWLLKIKCERWIKSDHLLHSINLRNLDQSNQKSQDFLFLMIIESTTTQTGATLSACKDKELGVVTEKGWHLCGTRPVYWPRIDDFFLSDTEINNWTCSTKQQLYCDLSAPRIVL